MEHSLVRRDVIKAAGAGLASTLLVGTAKAQTPAAAQTPAEFWTAEYTAKKGDVSLQMYRKRIGAPAPAAPRSRCCSWCTARRTAPSRATTCTCPARANTR